MDSVEPLYYCTIKIEAELRTVLNHDILMDLFNGISVEHDKLEMKFKVIRF